MNDDNFDKEAIERVKFPYPIYRFSYQYKKNNLKVDNIINYFSTWSLVVKRVEEFGV